jgi:hypothetical protein
MQKRQPARLDYEYERNGTANLFMMFAPLEGWRHVKVTERRTATHYANVLKDLSDVHFPGAKTIVPIGLPCVWKRSMSRSGTRTARNP